MHIRSPAQRVAMLSISHYYCHALFHLRDVLPGCTICDFLTLGQIQLPSGIPVYLPTPALARHLVQQAVLPFKTSQYILLPFVYVVTFTGNALHFCLGKPFQPIEAQLKCKLQDVFP